MEKQFVLFFVFLDKDVPFSKDRSLFSRRLEALNTERLQSVGLIIIRPKIRPFEDIPTENRPIGRYV